MATVRMRRALGPSLCFLLGVLFAWLSFGSMAFDPSAVQWLLISDRGQSFLGWHMARKEPWSYPFGALPSYLYPGGGSLALTDSYPWFSLLLLPASPYLGEVFQHAGLWLGLSYGLLGTFSFLLLRRLTRDEIGSAVATAIVIANPVLLFRRIHLSLCAHWLIVAALLLYFGSSAERRDPRFRLKATLLLVIAAGTHPYLAAMVFGIVAAAAWSERASLVAAVTSWAIFVACTLFALYSFGYFGGADLAGVGFGGYSANLLTFLDPNDWSTLLPDLPSGAGQYEGFAYLGLAPLALLAFAAAARAWRRFTHQPLPATANPRFRYRPLLVVIMGFALFSLSSQVFAGRYALLDLGW